MIRPMHVVKFCALECGRQQSGELSVYRMCMAYNYALTMTKEHQFPTVNTILELGRLVEPVINVNGFRTTPVTINYVPVPVIDFERVLGLYCKAWDRMIAREHYGQFEAIHPFKDGNGRVGAILYNWHHLDTPSIPPEFE